MKIRRGLFDVDGYWKKVLIDKSCELGVAIGFGFQPNASASSRGGAEVKQDWLIVTLGLGQRAIGVCNPLHGHSYSSVLINPYF
jgi:hypothetical protein